MGPHWALPGRPPLRTCPQATPAVRDLKAAVLANGGRQRGPKAQLVAGGRAGSTGPGSLHVDGWTINGPASPSCPRSSAHLPPPGLPALRRGAGPGGGASRRDARSVREHLLCGPRGRILLPEGWMVRRGRPPPSRSSWDAGDPALPSWEAVPPAGTQGSGSDKRGERGVPPTLWQLLPPRWPPWFMATSRPPCPCASHAAQACALRSAQRMSPPLEWGCRWPLHASPGVPCRPSSSLEPGRVGAPGASPQKLVPSGAWGCPRGGWQEVGDVGLMWSQASEGPGSTPPAGTLLLRWPGPAPTVPAHRDQPGPPAQPHLTCGSRAGSLDPWAARVQRTQEPCLGEGRRRGLLGGRQDYWLLG